MIVWLGSILVVAAFFLAWWGATAPRQPDLIRDNIRRGDAHPLTSRDAALQRSAGERLLDPTVDFMAAVARRFTSRGIADSIRHRLQLAGLLGRVSVEQVLAARLGLAVIGTVLAVLRLSSSTAGPAVAQAILIIVIAYLLPGAMLSRRADERQQQISLELPDVIDQITVSVEAGLGFDSAMARAARSGRGVFGQELSKVLQDIQVGQSRAQALNGLLDRTDVPDLRQFVFAVRQAEQYGLPIANILRIQSAELREKRRSRAEERAQQIPVKIVFPLVLCILPALFVVVLGPAGLQIFETF